LYLAPGARIDAPDEFLMRVGIELELRTSDVTVLYVFPDRLAAKSGVKVGDVIRRINGRSAEKSTLFDIKRILASQNRVRVEFRRPKGEGYPASTYTVDFE
jgi:C-terminal processing protease CtpA/Prc